MRNGIIVCRLSLIKTCLLAYHVLRKFRDSASLIKGDQMPTDTRGVEGGGVYTRPYLQGPNLVYTPTLRGPS